MGAGVVHAEPPCPLGEESGPYRDVRHYYAPCHVLGCLSYQEPSKEMRFTTRDSAMHFLCSLTARLGPHEPRGG